jgi:hypothetical protein
MVTGSGATRIPDPPVPFIGYKVSALDVLDELTYAQTNDAALDPSLQVA